MGADFAAADGRDLARTLQIQIPISIAGRVSGDAVAASSPGRTRRFITSMCKQGGNFNRPTVVKPDFVSSSAFSIAVCGAWSGGSKEET